jgi:hypothetical protein
MGTGTFFQKYRVLPAADDPEDILCKTVPFLRLRPYSIMRNF